MLIRTLILATAMGCSCIAMAVPKVDGTYNCKGKDGVNHVISFETRDEKIFLGGDFDAGQLAGAGNGLACLNKSDSQSSNGTTLRYTSTCNANALTMKMYMKAASMDMDMNMFIGVTKVSPTAVKIDVDVDGKIQGKVYPKGTQKLAINCTKK